MEREHEEIYLIGLMKQKQLLQPTPKWGRMHLANFESHSEENSHRETTIWRLNQA